MKLKTFRRLLNCLWACLPIQNDFSIFCQSLTRQEQAAEIGIWFRHISIIQQYLDMSLKTKLKEIPSKILKLLVIINKLQDCECHFNRYFDDERNSKFKKRLSCIQWLQQASWIMSFWILDCCVLIFCFLETNKTKIYPL